MADTPAPPPGFEPLSNEPPPPPGFEPMPAPGLLESLGRGVAEGATFGFDDKLGLDKERREASRKANPWTHFMGELVGGALPMAAASVLPTGVGQAAAAGRAAQLANRGAGLVRSALVPGEISTLGSAAAQGAKLGAVYGGLSGAGHADVSPDDTMGEALTKRATGAATGALTGAAVGPALGALGHGAYRGAQWLGGLRALSEGETSGLGQGALRTATRKLESDRITPDELIAQITSEFPDATASATNPNGLPLARRFWGGLGNKQPITSEQVEQTVRMAMEGRTASEISKALKAANGGVGPGDKAVQTLLDELAQRHLGPLNLVDRAGLVRKGSGDNTQMTMRAAAATPGEHVGIAREALLERQIGAQGRLGQLFDKMLGSSDYDGVAARHADSLQSAGQRAYGEAFANEQPFDLNPIFNKWVAKYQDMRGPIPDAVMAQLDAMRSSQPVLNASGALASTPKGGIVNKAPPMDLEGFILARQGLFDAIQSAKKDRPNLASRLQEIYNDMTAEVGRTNPKWLEANSIWRDGKAAEEALEAGARMTTRLNASSRENLTEFASAQKEAASAAKQVDAARKAGNQTAMQSAQARLDAANARMELFRVGLVRALNDMLANQGETHNLTRQLLLPGAQKMLRQVLGKDADQFFKAVRAEQAMHRTYQSQFGSQTTPLREAVDELTWAPRFEAHMLNPLSWANPAIRLAQEYAARTINSRRNTDLMRLYMETDPLKQLEALRAMQTLHTARSNAGNAVGRPVVGLSGVAPDPLSSLLSNESAPPPVLTPYRQR